MFVFRVTEPFLFPVAARPGDRLVVRPGGRLPIAVVRLVEGRWRLIRHGPPNYGALLPLLDTSLEPTDSAAAHVLRAIGS